MVCWAYYYQVYGIAASSDADIGYKSYQKENCIA
jgi:hypothetical protein